MAFKIGGGSTVSLETPERMFRDFAGRSYEGLLTHQGHILGEYQSSALNSKDVALQLPTGSGKTLVGLLISEWRRRKFNERCVYVAPTKQLVNQVVREASEKYGMSSFVRGFTGRQTDYDQAAKSLYQSGGCVAVTTYGGLFNANTFFDEPNFVLFDDAHASENYMADHWTLSVRRSDYQIAFDAIVSVLSEVLPPLDSSRMQSAPDTIWDQTWVDMIPSSRIHEIEGPLKSVIDAYTSDNKLRYSWRTIRNNLTACNVFVSANEILIRPLIPPTMRYDPFARAKQRLYMSATLGEGGDLERITGVQKITRLSLPEEYGAQAVGRRFFVFPGQSLQKDEQFSLKTQAITKAGRAVILVPDFKSAGEITENIATTIAFPTFDAAAIEQSKDPFVQADKAVAIFANRYDGIDFPHAQCRLLIIDGLPGASNLQERFLTSRLGARVLLADRIRTRVVQAFGRCTRSATDYSAVVVMGEDLLTYLNKNENRTALHPELQAEIGFGLSQSDNHSNMLDNLDIFYRRGEEWDAADNEIRRLRGEASQVQLPALSQLRKSADHEVAYLYAVWDGDDEKALAEARAILAELNDPGLKGYRALWFYMAGSSAGRLATSGMQSHHTIATDYYSSAAKASSGIRWLRDLSGLRKETIQEENPAQAEAPLIDRLEIQLDLLGTKHDQKYNTHEKKIADLLASDSANNFEEGQRLLGLLLGFNSGNEETQGAPDPWWLVDDDMCFVFEDYTEASESSRLSITKARQVASHPTWITQRLKLQKTASIIPILVTRARGAESDAVLHLKEVMFWELSDFRTWAKEALQVVRSLRVRFPGLGDMVWKDEAMTAYHRHGLGVEGIRARLKPLEGLETFY